MREHKSNKNTILSSFIITKSKFNYQIIEEIEIHDKNELHQWEQYYMDKWDCVNKQNSFISNDDKKIRDYTTHKKYLEKYNKDNKQKLEQKFKCECDGKYTYQSKSIHFKSKKHQRFLNSIKSNLE
jgi:hypothetical protein